MKSPIMLVCALVAAMSMSVSAVEQGAAAGGDKTQVQAKAKPAKLTEAQREELMNKRLESIKAKDEALYKELVALKEKDPAAFKAKMRELSKTQGKVEGQGHKAGKKVAPKEEPKK